jgi:glycosyltransferase involved in cell wall biosynthesis
MKPKLSVVMPVYNEASYLPATIEALLRSLDRSSFDAELIVVDDGSRDGSGDIARKAVGGSIPIDVVTQPNSGRFEARSAGAARAVGEWLLLLDARVRIQADALAYVEHRVREGRIVWTGHVDVATAGNPYGEFWKLLAELAWSDYFDNPRDTSFGVEDFDRFPKGTGCFFAPLEVVREAVQAFQSAYSETRHANDDTPLIRWIAERERINISPGFACDYRPRTSFGGFVRHSFHRGIVFLDGHGRPASRFFPAAVAFYPASALLAAAALRRPSVAACAAAATSAAAGAVGIARRRSPSEVVTLASLAPLYAVAHGAGMWRGLALLRRLRQ